MFFMNAFTHHEGLSLQPLQLTLPRVKKKISHPASQYMVWVQLKWFSYFPSPLQYTDLHMKLTKLFEYWVSIEAHFLILSYINM